MIRENLENIKGVVKEPKILVAVSKTKPIEDIMEAYAAGHFDFGENYIQELVSKSDALKDSCPSIRWHFIGALQSNKIGLLLTGVSRLASIQTIDSLDKLKKIIKILSEKDISDDDSNVNVVDLFLQVNISDEVTKHGLKEVKDIVECYKYFHDQSRIKSIKHCHLQGLMMIGEPSASLRDFTRMKEIKEEVQSILMDCNIITTDDIKLSMGMSDDYQLAIEMGSDVVRIGSAIFGSRK